jgi:hypothetical protein
MRERPTLIGAGLALALADGAGTGEGVGDTDGIGCAGPRAGRAVSAHETAATNAARRGFTIAD